MKKKKAEEMTKAEMCQRICQRLRELAPQFSEPEKILSQLGQLEHRIKIWRMALENK